MVLRVYLCEQWQKKSNVIVLKDFDIIRYAT